MKLNPIELDSLVRAFTVIAV